MAKLSKKDFDILDFIFKQTKLNGFPPSVREVCKEFSFSSTASAYNRMKKLEEAGYLLKGDSKNRALKVVNYTPLDYSEETDVVNVPVYGRVAAGIPITAIQTNEETFPISRKFARSRDLFMLKVSGDSMINAGIYDGDYIIVNHQETVDNGDIAVAQVSNNEEATVKTFYKENGHFRLQPENDYMDPIIVDEVTIIGKVVGLFREF